MPRPASTADASAYRAEPPSAWNSASACRTRPSPLSRFAVCRRGHRLGQPGQPALGGLAAAPARCLPSPAGRRSAPALLRRAPARRRPRRPAQTRAPAPGSRAAAILGDSRTCPRSGASCPVMIRSSVVLPDPFGPIRPARSPRLSVKLTRSSTLTSPNHLVISRTVSIRNPRQAKGERAAGCCTAAPVLKAKRHKRTACGAE